MCPGCDEPLIQLPWPPPAEPFAVVLPSVALHAESQKQYWQVKSKYRDTIIFFKVGKFYELYEVGSQDPRYNVLEGTVASYGAPLWAHRLSRSSVEALSWLTTGLGCEASEPLCRRLLYASCRMMPN